MTTKNRLDEDKLEGKIYDRKVFNRLMSYGKPYWHLISLTVLLIIGGMGLQILGPYLTKIAIDNYIIPGDMPGLYKIVGIYLLVLLGNFILNFIQIMLMQYLGQKVMLDLRQELFSHLQRLQQQFFDKNPIGRLMTRVTSDVESLNQVFTQGIVMVFGDLLLIGGIVVMMLSIHLPLALWTLSIVPVLIFISFIFRKKVRESYSQIRFFLAKINSYLQEHISGMSIVQLYNREKRNFETFRSINWNHTMAYIKTIFYFAIFFPAVELISAVTLGIIIYQGGFYIQNQLVTFGIMIAFIQYAQMFFRPISDLSEKYNILQSALASSERIFKLLDTEPSIESLPNGYKTDKIEKAIELNNVNFAYNSDPVLVDINLHIPIGKKYALVGHTGAGKTSLTRLLGRFYDIQEGSITVNGVEIQQWDLENLRSHMAVVPQDVFLFSGTVKENIRLGNANITEEEVKRAAELVNADQFINKLPGQYEAKIRERGSNLSQGQKQLLALARAIVYNPAILIMDEATSNIDSESEYLIQQALKTVMTGRTSIVIAHRLSTIQYMDKIIVMHHGKIHERGDHQELLKKRGLYYRLYQLQYKEQETSIY
jgi:ATP-binding cassette subfamily B protein